MLKKRSVLGFKEETTPGTFVTVGAADAAFDSFNAAMQPETAFQERMGQGSLSPIAGTLSAYGAVCTYQLELVFGSPTPAALASSLKACGWQLNNDILTPESRSPGSSGSGAKTLSMALWEDGVLTRMRGCMGDFVATFPAGDKIVFDFTMRGAMYFGGADEDEWEIDSALIAPDYPGKTPMRFATVGLALGAWSPVLQQLVINSGNTLELRPDANAVQQTGIHSAVVTGRRINGTINPEAVVNATKKLTQEWRKRTEQALTFTVTAPAGDADEGKSAAFSIPKLQFTGQNRGDRNGVSTRDLAWQANRATDAGDDEASITFAG